MLKITSELKLEIVFLFIFLTFLSTTGLGHNNLHLLLIFALGSLVYLTNLFRKGKFELPEDWKEYVAFLIMVVLSLFWSFDRGRTLYYIILFISASLVWIIFYNQKKYFLKYVTYIVITLGFAMLAFYLREKILGNIRFDSLSLYLPAKLLFSHNHLGDLWALITLIVLDKVIFAKKRWWLALAPLAIYALYVSQSRSAYVSLFVGILYLIKIKKPFFGWSKTSIATIAFIAVLFVMAGAGKTLIFSRPYFMQSLIGLVKYPYGVGLGNFSLLSFSMNQGKNLFDNYSAYTHNIFLEMFTGIGVYGLIFAYWFCKVAINIFFQKEGNNYIYKVLFLSLTVNFMFDYTYFIPAMLYLWFAFLGLSQTESKKYAKK